MNALTTTAFDQIKTNLTLSTDDLVNVFISKYEDGLTVQRTSNQALVQGINKQIKTLGDRLLDETKQMVEGSDVLEAHDFGFFTQTISVEKDSYKLDWDNGCVLYRLQFKLRSNSTTDHYNSSSAGSISCKKVIAQSDMDYYKDLMAEKSRLTSVLTEINNQLRDVSRKERQIRGRLAEQKFAEAGLEALLQDQSLLQLIDTSVITGQ